MKKIIGISALLTMVLLAANVLAPDLADSIASVTVLETCGIEADDIDFGEMVPGQTVSDIMSTISMPTGNTEVTPDVSGSAWTGGTGMPVGQTSWSLISEGTYIALTTDFETLDSEVSYGNPLDVYFQLAVPAGQAAADYTQTITFQVEC